MNLRSCIQLAGCLALLASAALVAAPALAASSARTIASSTPSQSAPPAVAAPSSVDPSSGAPKGTMIMAYGSGWAGHSARSQKGLLQRPGDLLVQRGWRVVSVDYGEGPHGLQDVLNAAGSELQRKTGDGPLCIYGESSGAHLALVAASRLRAIDCVIGLGAPTDLSLYRSEGSVSTDPRVGLVVSQISRLFGTTPAELAPWDLTALAPALRADVLLLHEGDDTLVPATQSARFQAARPTTQTLDLEAGDPADPTTGLAHGTVSVAGRAQYASAIGGFADRAVAARQAARSAAQTGCSDVNRSVAQAGLQGLRSALRCLAQRDPDLVRAGAARWKQTSVKLRGEVSAARIWANLRATTRGRRALVAAAKRRVTVTVRTGDKSRVTLRATR